MNQTTIELGQLLDDGCRLKVDIEVFRHHCLLLGAEGCGKTTLATAVFQELLDKGVSIIAIDTRGDLTSAVSQKHCVELKRGVGVSSGVEDGGYRLASIDLQMATGMFVLPDSTVGEENRNEENEVLVSALLEVLGLKRRRYSPEYALLVQILDHFHDRQTGVNLAQLPELIRNPPFSKIGIFSLDAAISANRRDDFASAVISLLETPSYALSAAVPGVDVGSLLSTANGEPRCTVLSFTDRTLRIRQFLVAILGSKLRSTRQHNPLLVWIDEASDFVSSDQRSTVSRLMLGGLHGWAQFATSFVLTAHRISDLHEDVDNYCDTMIVGQMPEINARRDAVSAMDLVNPPVDEKKLDQELKQLRRGQFILRSPHLDSLQRFEIQN